MKKTHEEYMRIAKILGEHIGCELNEPLPRTAFLLMHFIKHPDCPLCADAIEKSKSLNRD